MLSKQTLASKSALVILMLLLVFLADLKFRQYRSQAAVAQQTQSLQQQVDALQKQNDSLNQFLQKINSPDFKEQVARQQLNYKKQGEVVYGFTPAASAEGATDTIGASSNFRQWWNYFFAD